MKPAPRESLRKLIAFLKTQPTGADTKACARVVGLSAETCRKYMRTSEEIFCLPAAQNTRWCLRHQLTAAKEWQYQKRVEYYARWNRKHHMTGKTPKRIAPIKREPVPDWIPQQVRVDARTAPPIQKTGPASVWELAA